MAAPKVWVSAARLRTLPLSLSGIIVGNALALGQVGFRLSLFGLALITAVALQVLSIFAIDYVDVILGLESSAGIVNRADANGDGTVNVLDVQEIVSIVLNH